MPQAARSSFLFGHEYDSPHYTERIRTAAPRWMCLTIETSAAALDTFRVTNQSWPWCLVVASVMRAKTDDQRGSAYLSEKLSLSSASNRMS